MTTPTPQQQRRARIFGWLFAGTFITSIGALPFYDSVLNHTDFILGGGFDTKVSAGALCEVFLAITNIGTAVVLYPIVKRQSQTLGLTFVASRTVESVMILVGVLSLMSVVTLRNDLGAGASDAAATIAGQGFVAMHDWTFLLGPGFCVGVNGLVLGYLMYKTGLVPRWIAYLGLIGGPMIFLASIGVLFGAYDQMHAPIPFVFGLPEIAFELSITIYTIVKGFRPSPVLDDARYERA